jgi:hypothetical protein
LEGKEAFKKKGDRNNYTGLSRRESFLRCGQWMILVHISISIIIIIIIITIKSCPVTGLEWPRGFQEVKVPRFHDNGAGWW